MILHFHFILSIDFPEASQQHESEQSNGQKSLVNDQTFAFNSDSFATAKKVCSVDVSSTIKATNQSESSGAAKMAKPANENIKIEKDLAALKKEILSLYGQNKDPFKLPKVNEKDGKAAFPITTSTNSIGMFGNKGDNVNWPSFSFSLPDNNDLLAHDNGVKPAKTLEPGIY